MHYIAYVSAENFYAKEAASRLSWPDSKPLVVVRDQFAIDLNASAKSAGCVSGMTKSEAMAVLADSSCFTNFSREDSLAKRDEWLKVCAEFCDIIEPEDFHSAFIDLSMHSDPLDVARSLKASLVTRLSMQPTIRVSVCKWLSRIAPEHLESVPEVGQWLPYLGVEKLPISRKDILRLKLLGYRTIGEVAMLPKQLIKAQFCERAWLIHDLANGRLIDLPRPLFPESFASFKIQIESGVSDWQSIERHISRLCLPIAKTLSRLDSNTRTIELKLIFESGKTVSLCRTFTKPIHTRKGLTRAIAVMLPEIVEPITSIEATCPKLERRTIGQVAFDESPSDTAVAAESALLAIRKTYGDSSIQSADEIELPRHVEVMRAWKAATGWF